MGAANKVFSRYRVPFPFTTVPSHFIDDGWLFELPKDQMVLILSILRLTWGHRKAKDAIALSQLVGKSQLSLSTVKRGLKKLRECGILRIYGPQKRPRIYEIDLSRRLNIAEPTDDFGKLTQLSLPKAHMVTHTIDNRQPKVRAFKSAAAGKKGA
jgi:DNA-binding transcriptional ArsR family regulator